MTKEIKIKNNSFVLKDEIETIIEKKVTKFGNGCKVDCPRKYQDKRVYLLILNN